MSRLLGRRIKAEGHLGRLCDGSGIPIACDVRVSEAIAAGCGSRRMPAPQRCSARASGMPRLVSTKREPRQTRPHGLHGRFAGLTGVLLGNAELPRSTYNPGDSTEQRQVQANGRGAVHVQEAD